ncbi:flagellar basal body rod protein FlgB [Alginatibacterium sediminis]|uniref:Flagellar basal body rod protein FlgB n=1 Tax=Alginatibacterium sediminis TaxID=2164068 RepID=A0A420EFY6_9ALTE|nr:flagellar basal body rod protein FlgB [Alginatibacterium sediminis]RKF19622.1 flagellar basal body rod protein FlgB [Alginatibacterium sediminis]
MAISFDKAFGVHQYTAGVRAKRAEVIASNIANADTPGYKARDVDFSKALANAKTNQNVRMATTNERHIGGASGISNDISYKVPTQPDTGDGNTVELDKEKNSFMQNGLEYQAGMNFLNSKVMGLKKSINGN